MKRSWRILSVTMFVSLLCGHVSAGTIIVGQPRPPISPDRVKVYWDPPRKYDRIAIITKGSGGGTTLYAPIMHKTVQAEAIHVRR